MIILIYPNKLGVYLQNRNLTLKMSAKEPEKDLVNKCYSSERSQSILMKDLHNFYKYM